MCVISLEVARLRLVWNDKAEYIGISSIYIELLQCFLVSTMHFSKKLTYEFDFPMYIKLRPDIFCFGIPKSRNTTVYHIQHIFLEVYLSHTHSQTSNRGLQIFHALVDNNRGVEFIFQFNSFVELVQLQEPNGGNHTQEVEKHTRTKPAMKQKGKMVEEGMIV